MLPSSSGYLYCLSADEKWLEKDGGDHYVLVPADQNVVKAKELAAVAFGNQTAKIRTAQGLNAALTGSNQNRQHPKISGRLKLQGIKTDQHVDDDA